MIWIKETEWRFLDNADGTVIYGTGADPNRFADSRFLAMPRIRKADALGADVFAGDVLEVHGWTDKYLCYAEGTLLSKHGESKNIGMIKTHYQIVRSLPNGWDSE